MDARQGGKLREGGSEEMKRAARGLGRGQGGRGEGRLGGEGEL